MFKEHRMYYLLLFALLSFTGAVVSKHPKKPKKYKVPMQPPANSVADLLSQGSLTYKSQEQTINDQQVVIEIAINDPRITSLAGLAKVPGITTCKKLFIYDTTLTAINPGDFASATALEELSITNNAHLQTIAPNSFAPLSQLTSLNLSDNEHFKEVPANIFQGLSSLRALNISNRHIRKLQAGWVNGLTNLRVIYTKGLGDQLDQRIYNDLNNRAILTKRGWKVKIARN